MSCDRIKLRPPPASYVVNLRQWHRSFLIAIGRWMILFPLRRTSLRRSIFHSQRQFTAWQTPSQRRDSIQKANAREVAGQPRSYRVDARSIPCLRSRPITR